MERANINKTAIKRKIISLETKIEILDRLRNKERIVDIAKFFFFLSNSKNNKEKLSLNQEKCSSWNEYEYENHFIRKDRRPESKKDSN